MGIQTTNIRLMTIPTIGKQWEFRSPELFLNFFPTTPLHHQQLSDPLMTFWDDGFRLLRRYLPWGGLRPDSWAVRCPLSTTGGGTARWLLCLLCCWLPLDPTGLPRAANPFFQATWILRKCSLQHFGVHKIHQDDGWTIFIQVFAEQKEVLLTTNSTLQKNVSLLFFSGWPLGNDGMDPPKNQRLDPPYEGMRFDSVEVRGSPVTTSDLRFPDS